MTGLIVVFSALGGTLGSRIIGYLFKNEGPENAFYYTLIPMSLLLVSFFILKKLTAKIETVTGIKNQSGNQKDFIRTVLKDYNFYTQSM